MIDARRQPQPAREKAEQGEALFEQRLARALARILREQQEKLARERTARELKR